MIKVFNNKTMSITLVMLIVFSPFEFLNSQSNKDSLQAAKLLQLAETSAAQQDYQNSTLQALDAINIFENLNDWDNCLNGYYQIFYNGLYAQDYSSSVSAIEKGKTKVPENRLDILAKMDYFLGYSYNELGDVFSSLEAYESSVVSFLMRKDTSWLVSIYGNLGIAYTQLGEYTTAIDYLNNAVTMGHEIKDSATLLNNLWNLGEAYFSNSDWELAQQAYSRANELKQSSDGTFEFFMAEIQLEQKKTTEALQSIKDAIRLTKKEYGTDDENVAPMEKLLAEIYLEAQQPKLALNNLLKILPYYKKSPNKRDLGKLYILIANTRYALKQYDLALENHQTAFKILLPNFKEEDITSNPDKKIWNREIWLMEIFKGKANCFFEKFQLDNDIRWLYLAEENHHSAIEFIQKIKLGFEKTSSKLYLGSYTHPFYENLIKVKLKLFGLNQETKYKEAAFQTAQTANAFVLRELLNEQEALSISGVEQDSIDLLNDIRQKAISIQRKIERSNSSETDTLQTQLSALKAKHQQLKISIEQNYPEFHKLRNDLKVATSQQLQEKLDDSSLFLKYFLGEKILYIFSISNKDFKIDTIALPQKFSALLFQYRRAVSDLDFIKSKPQIAEQEYLYSAFQLYKILLEKPLKAHSSSGQEIQRFFIVADGPLNTIPFQALLLKESESWTNSTHFVISEYALSYTYFSKMLLTPFEQTERDGGFVSFGLEFDDYTLQHLEKVAKDSIKNKAILENLRSGTLSKLPFSDEEAQELASLMNGTPWINEEATKSNFLEHAMEAGIIHVATHSVLNRTDPNQSALIFTKKEDAPDNLLRQEEIYNLRSAANMIVLSACNTAYGQSQKAEGLNSLARAFNFAGIPSVTATFWNISDEASKKMMLLYYTQLKAGNPKDIAMQKAQLEYLSNDNISSPIFRSPVYWAAWMPVGDNRKIPKSKRNFPFVPFLAFAASLLLILLIFRRKTLIKGI